MDLNKENFHEDELEAPEWLNLNFMAKALRRWAKDSNFQVEDLKITPGTNKGDHYGSVMFRAVVQYLLRGQKKTKSLIIKTMPDQDGSKKEMLKDLGVFEAEIGMYVEVLPKFHEILTGVGDHTVLGAECIYHSLSPKKVIIFEDLVQLGYATIRGRNLTLEEVKAVYSKLAKWHAVSHKLVLENPSLLHKYERSWMSSSTVSETSFTATGIDNFVDLLSSVETLREYKSYFESIKPNVVNSCIASFKEYYEHPRTDPFFVLCHGDFHMKNMMFKHNPSNGKFEDVMLLDFQIPYQGPAANDLIYSFFMVLSLEQRVENFEELLKFYFDVFLNTLKKIRCNGDLPTLQELKEQWKQSRNFEIYLLVTLLPIWIGLKSGQVDPGLALNSPEFRRDVLYKSKELIKELQILLPRYKRLGYFTI